MDPPILHLGNAGGLDVGVKGEYVTLGYPGEARTFSPHIAIGLAALLRTAARLALKQRAAEERRRQDIETMNSMGALMSCPPQTSAPEVPRA